MDHLDNQIPASLMGTHVVYADSQILESGQPYLLSYFSDIARMLHLPLVPCLFVISLLFISTVLVYHRKQVPQA